VAAALLAVAVVALLLAVECVSELPTLEENGERSWLCDEGMKGMRRLLEGEGSEEEDASELVLAPGECGEAWEAWKACEL
jgi:hypothetical protein